MEQQWGFSDLGLFGSGLSYCSDEGCYSHVTIMDPFYAGEEADAYDGHSSYYLDSWQPMSHTTDYNFYLNKDIAIRQYCAARLEHQLHQRFDQFDEMEIELFSNSERPGSPLLDLAEQDELIESFINMEEDSESDDMAYTPKGKVAPVKEDDERISNREITAAAKSGGGGEVDEGLHLVHLLLACAEAVGCRDSQLATTVLQQIWKSAHPRGDSLQRVTWCFARGLTSRLSSLLQKETATTAPVMVQLPDRPDVMLPPSKAERAEGFQVLYQCTPYISFGFMAANEAIVQAVEGKKSVHILDLGMVQALQWPALIRKLASRPEGPPTLRLTGMGPLGMEEWAAALAEEAKSFGVPFEFRGITEPLTPGMLDSKFLQLRQEETLVINSVLQLHRFVKESRGSLRCLLQAMHRLNPVILTVVEQDANHNGPFFLGRFLESLHYYSAIFDSLEASLPRSSPQRMKVETFHFAEEIRNIVACEGPERIERHERADQWRRQLGRSGFHAVPLRFMSQARMMLSVYGCDGYSLAEEKGSLLLGWKGRTIMLASAWRPHIHSP